MITLGKFYFHLTFSFSLSKKTLGKWERHLEVTENQSRSTSWLQRGRQAVLTLAASQQEVTLLKVFGKVTLSCTEVESVPSELLATQMY